MSAPSLEAEDFERRYRSDPDPWSYETSHYEQAKYARTLTALPASPIARALELGCSNGAFTVLLAERCAGVLAADFSAEAVKLARARTDGLAGVNVERRDLRRALPPGRFDLIVCSELLYYWRREDVLAFCEAVVDSLEPGGSLLAVHWRGADPAAPLDGEAVHQLLAERLDDRLDHDRSERQPEYLLDRWMQRAER